MRFFLLMVFALQLLSCFAYGQTKVSGTVTDAKDIGLPGVTVKVKGKSAGAITDANGRYSLNAGGDDVLVLTSIGFVTREVKVSNRENIDVQLTAAASTGLDEVVVVAYGTQKKGSVTGAIATVSNKELVKVSNNDLTNALTGRAPGVRVQQLSSEPGKFDNQIDIRGFSYVDPNQNNNILQLQTGGPLFVIDGVQRDQAAFNRLDANEVESVSVLKDATAAIYGVKAANGVILVTTRKGKAGDMNVFYSGQWGKQIITKYPSLSNAAQYATLYDEMQINNQISNQAQLTPPRFTAAQIADYQSGKLPGTNFLGLILNKTTTQKQQDITVSGGSEKLKYFLSGGYFNAGGLFRSDIQAEQKYNLRSNVQAELAKGLNLGVNLSFINDYSKGTSEAIWSLLANTWRIDPTEKAYANDNPLYLNQFQDAQLRNPLAETSEKLSGYARNTNKFFTSTFDLTYQIPFVQGLSAKGLYAYDNQSSFGKQFHKKYFQYSYLFDSNNAGYYSPNVHNAPSNLEEDYGQNTRKDLQLSLNYNRSFGKSTIGALALYEQIDRIYNSHSAYTQFIIDAVDQLAAGDHTTDKVNSGYSQNTNKSFIGKVNYDYAGKYLAEFGFRYDGSSNFPKNSRWGFFPYGSIGWRISEEPFIKDNLKFLDNLKLRASYGKLGDDQAAAFQFLTGYTYPSNGYQFGTGYTSGLGFQNSPNLNLTWYTSTTSDIGIEGSMLKGLLSFEADVFRRDRDGLLAYRNSTIPGTYGVNLPQVNLNSDRTQGFEFTLGHANKIGQLSYSVSANISYTRTENRYVEQNPSSNDYDYYRNSSQNRYNDIVWGYKAAGQFQSYQDIYKSPIQDGAGNRTVLPGDIKYTDLNGDGIIDGRDQTTLGNAHQKPNFYYGTTIDLAWKGFDFSVLFQGTAKYHVYYTDQLSAPFFNQANPISIFNDRWHRTDIFDPNSTWVPGKYPSTGERGNYQVSSFWLRDASYLRIKSMAIGYSFSNKILKKINVNKLRVFAQGYNIFTWTKGLNFIDPEYADNRLYSYNYPVTLNLNFGVQLTF
jgi:TonB-linked SusC/RagA family outer membrane protein